VRLSESVYLEMRERKVNLEGARGHRNKSRCNHAFALSLSLSLSINIYDIYSTFKVRDPWTKSVAGMGMKRMGEVRLRGRTCSFALGALLSCVLHVCVCVTERALTGAVVTEQVPTHTNIPYWGHNRPY
jgi:hypothetical protein